MLTRTMLAEIEKEGIDAMAEELEQNDLDFLIDALSEKNERLRYRSFLLLQSRSRDHCDVYPYWGILEGKLTSETACQRSLGAMLLAANVKWDEEDRMPHAIDAYLDLLSDENSITRCQSARGLSEIIVYKPKLHRLIIRRIGEADFLGIKETMRKIFCKELCRILNWIKNNATDDAGMDAANVLAQIENNK